MRRVRVGREMGAVAVVAMLLPMGAVVVTSAPASAPALVFEGPVTPARCGKGSLPETGLQGQVPLADRQSGRSTLGYRCNLKLIGQFQGEGSSWVSQIYKDCAYMSTRYAGSVNHPGVQVLDVRNPSKPRRVGALTDPAMLGPWESLKVNTRRGLLAAVAAPGPAGNGAGFLAVYDIRDNCRRPRLLSSVSSTDLSLPTAAFGHEGSWSPDGRTYWSTSAYGGGITAIDLADPAQPRALFVGETFALNHGLSLSRDGRLLYIARIGLGYGVVIDGNGVQIFDVSSIQDRDPVPQMRLIGEELWTDGIAGQHAIEVTYGSRPHLIFVDEGGAGAARILDVSNPANPTVIAKLKLEIHMPENADIRAADTVGNGQFGYEGHYCAVDRLRNPRAVACGYFQSGVRVFDISNPLRPHEVAYYNPPAQVGQTQRLVSSEHAANPLVSGAGTATLSADWCSSPPQFVDKKQLWVACQDNGFMTLRFTSGSSPLD